MTDENKDRQELLMVGGPKHGQFKWVDPTDQTVLDIETATTYHRRKFGMNKPNPLGVGGGSTWVRELLVYNEIMMDGNATMAKMWEYLLQDWIVRGGTEFSVDPDAQAFVQSLEPGATLEGGTRMQNGR